MQVLSQTIRRKRENRHRENPALGLSIWASRKMTFGPEPSGQCPFIADCALQGFSTSQSRKCHSG